MRMLKIITALLASSASVVVLGAVRNKVLAVATGAEGIGLLGVMSTALTFLVIVSGWGLGTTGVRMAAEHARTNELDLVRAALVRGSAALAALPVALGAVALPVLYGRVDDRTVILGAALVVALSASILAGAQTAFLNGIGDIRACVMSPAGGALAATVLTLLFVPVSDTAAIAASFVAPSLGTLALTSFYLRRHPGLGPPPSVRDWSPQFWRMSGAGAIFSLSVAAGAVTQFIVRLLQEREPGLAAVGHYQAAWSLSSVYVGVALSALALEFFPRISAIAKDVGSMHRQVDDQITFLMLFLGPLILWAMLLAPLVIRTFYSADFEQSIELFRLQMFGDVFKVFSWSVAFVLLAREAMARFMVAEVVWNLAYLTTLGILGIDRLESYAWAYVVGYIAYVLIVLVFVRSSTGYLPARRARLLTLITTSAAGYCLWATQLRDDGTVAWDAWALAVTLTIGFGIMVPRAVRAARSVSVSFVPAN